MISVYGQLHPTSSPIYVRSALSDVTLKIQLNRICPFTLAVLRLTFHPVFHPSLQVSLPEAEVKAGLALQPAALEVSLVDRPLSDLLFTQFMASVSGRVYCLGKPALEFSPISL